MLYSKIAPYYDQLRTHFDHFVSTLTEQQKKVALVALAILCVVVIYSTFRRYFKSKVVPLKETPPSVLTKTESVPSTSSSEKTTVKMAHLIKEIDLLKNGDDNQKNKAGLFQQAIDRFEDKKASVTLETFRLEDKDQFHLTADKMPAYFNDKFNDKNELNIEITPNFYDYINSSEREDYWVDFANSSLGGACFTHGFVQEEIMVAEMPDFADHIAEHVSATKPHWSDVFIREGHLDEREWVKKGSPNPYLMKGLTRVQAVDKQAYGRPKFKDLLETTKSLPVPQKVNVVAIAAPRLHNKEHSEQWDRSTLEDCFNSLMAGFKLVDEQSKNYTIHSGKIGCGAFNNDIHAIFLVHCFIAQHLKVSLKLHGYTDEEKNIFEPSWKKLTPKLTDHTLQECVAIISEHLKTNY